MSQLLAKFEKPLVDATGVIQPSATITVHHSGTLDKPQLYSRRDGSLLMDNPFVADSNGIVKFFTASGVYDIKVELEDKVYFLKDESIVDYESFMNNIDFYRGDIIYRGSRELSSVFIKQGDFLVASTEFTIRFSDSIHTVPEGTSLVALPIYTSNSPPTALDAHIVFNSQTKEFSITDYGSTVTHPSVIVGGISINDVTYQFIELSLWDLSFRPYSDPRQMVFNNSYNVWVDIYPLDDDYGLTRDHSAPNKPIKTFSSLVDASMYTLPLGKRLASSSELINSSSGTENTFELSPVATTGYINNRQSTIGANQMTGCFYTWTSEGILYGKELHDDILFPHQIINESGAIRLVSDTQAY